jgi:Holliday junction DNA helicase RuvB
MDEKLIGSDINQVQITSLSKIRGQKKVIDLLRVNLDAYFQNRSQGKPSTFGPALLCGPSGTGKTLVAKAIHAELGNGELIETNGEMLSNANELISILMSATENTSVFVDEAQGMSTRSMHIWLTALSERVVYLPRQGTRNNKRVIPLENFTVLMGTTHEYCLLDALRNRFRIYCRFEYYSLEDMIEILRQRVMALGWGVESEDVLIEIAKRSKKTPRIALNRNLQMGWSVCNSQGRNTITMDDMKEAFRLINIDSLGLDKLERDYLKVLQENGPTALNLISSKLSLPTQTIRTVLEPYLIQEGLVAKEKTSHRMLTPMAVEHLSRMES